MVITFINHEPSRVTVIVSSYKLQTAELQPICYASENRQKYWSTHSRVEWGGKEAKNAKSSYIIRLLLGPAFSLTS